MRGPRLEHITSDNRRCHAKNGNDHEEAPAFGPTAAEASIVATFSAVLGQLESVVRVAQLVAQRGLAATLVVAVAAAAEAEGSAKSTEGREAACQESHETST